MILRTSLLPRGDARRRRHRTGDWRGVVAHGSPEESNNSISVPYDNDRLAPGILKELKKKNPTNEKGHRKVKHHQFLTEDIGHPALAQHLHAAMALMRSSPNWNAFERSLNRAFPRRGDTFRLPFREET